MNEILLVINFCAIIMCVIALVLAVRNYKESQKTREFHAVVSPAMALCSYYVRDNDFFERKNGGDDYFELNNPIKYVSHMDKLKVMIEE